MSRVEMMWFFFGSPWGAVYSEVSFCTGMSEVVCGMIPSILWDVN